MKVLTVLFALLVVGFVVLSLLVNQRAATAIEERTSAAFGLPAHLDGARVGLFTGSLSLGPLDVANVEGFPSARLLRTGAGEGRVRIATLIGEVVELPRLVLADVDLHLERVEGRGNYEAVLAHYREVERAPPADGYRYMVDELLLRNVIVHLDLLPDLGEAARLEVPIDSIRLTQVGTEAERGLPLEEVAGAVLKALVTSVLEQAARQLPPHVARELADRLGALDELEALLEVGERRIEGLRELMRRLPFGVAPGEDPDDPPPSGEDREPGGDL